MLKSSVDFEEVHDHMNWKFEKTHVVLYHRFTPRCVSFSRFGNASCVTDVWSPYRITPIHWLMARRYLWRNHVISLYWRTRHPLLRWTAFTKRSHCPSLLRFSGPKIIYFGRNSSICTSATAYSGTLFSLRWSAMEYRRCQPPCAWFIARDDPHSKCIKYLGFSHLSVNFVRISVS